MNATNIDIDILRIDVDNMLRKWIIDQDYKILKSHIDGDVALDTIHFSTKNISNTNENKNIDSSFPFTQVAPNEPNKDPTLVSINLENNTTILALPLIKLCKKERRKFILN